MALSFTATDFDALAKPKHAIRYGKLDYKESSTMQRLRAPSKSLHCRPAFADNTAQFQAVLLQTSLSYIFRNNIPPDFSPDLNDVIELARQRTSANKHQVSHSQALLQQRIWQHVLTLEHIGYVALIGAIAYRSWRLHCPAPQVAQELGVSKRFVNRMCMKLIRSARQLGFETYRQDPRAGRVFLDVQAITDLWNASHNVELVSYMLEYDENTVRGHLDRLGLKPKRKPTKIGVIRDTWTETENLEECVRRSGHCQSTVVRVLGKLKLYRPTRRRKAAG